MADDFAPRHIGPRPEDIAAMLEVVGSGSLDELIDKAVPSIIRSDDALDIPAALSESEALAALRHIADRNEVFTSMIGLGYTNTITPAVIRRNVLQDPSWYTAYTPYQPEISQGRLEALLNFQTMVMDLTGMEIANSSMLDEGTSAAEAMTMLRRVSKVDGNVFYVADDIHPQTLAVLQTRAEPLGIDVIVGPATGHLPDGIFGAIMQYPGTTGAVPDLGTFVQRVHDAGGLVTVAADILALVLLPSPGSLGADVVVGSSQRFGVPMGFGGPHAAYFATREAYKRTIPGRLVGVTRDVHGRQALRLALQTREQHIRRDKATSNICTAQVLLAVIAGMYGAYHGPEGLRTIARKVVSIASAMAQALRDAGLDVVNDSAFDTVTVRVADGHDVIQEAAVRRINLRLVDDGTVSFTVDETTTEEIARNVLVAFGVIEPMPTDAPSLLPAERNDEILAHPVFHLYRSETEMLRYLRRLSDKDIALDRAMIPLGSCTMKLNAATEMEPITWPEFADIHPFAPWRQAQGYVELFEDLEAWLCEITGYDAVSLQPNAGSQGEYAGLLAIRGYHASRGEGHRDVCLIPASAHGTNPASAVMAGLRVVVVACDEQGNVDVADLQERASEHSDNLAAIMVTYPSTHGVFEEAIREVCDIVHAHGGQVYLDGANLNAMLGVAKPGEFGADVSHLNLHKTFAIPHGGGGPGVGPIGVGAHLAPFLPGHPLEPEAGPGPAVSSAPWGSAGVLPISWAYIAMMGAEGLRASTDVAILSANYIATRLEPHFPVLYRGPAGYVAHECIIDIRPLHRDAEITVDDVAKRLIDYGFHAPTMSFPVAGTLMIEPTESESKEELDRFCDAMIAIRAEIARVESGEWTLEDSPVRNAPHTAEDLLAEDWNRPYSRELAAYPVRGLIDGKYWPPVSRVDNQYGDKNLMCACPPMEAYE